ncbi:hypothetical protein [Pseudomonas sp. PD9R]|uniref:hypothetical protein n=1 Tax=Pseudomonas sp. PD9R TaxID=2853534 RepID=UPI001C489DE4|nr:hypothetical protein [Pseudomonas sp. PD9R]MBV6822810.1 hypothetical protein [Pseudomonas sp. PD9R]
MQADLTVNLKHRYPDAFLPRSEACFKLECGDGWYSIIETLCSLMTELNRREGQQPTYLQGVREKLGTMRVLVSGRVPEAHAWIIFAEQHSARTCEVCGGRGQLLCADGWQRVRCEIHLSFRIIDG